MEHIKAIWKESTFPEKAIRVMYAAMMAGILVICLLLQGIAYAKKWDRLPNCMLLPCAIGMMALAVPVLKRFCDRSNRKKGPAFFLGMGALLLFTQLILIRQYYFYTDWDVETIAECALAVVNGTDISRHSNYFSMYQNNLVLVTLFSWVARLAVLLGQGEHAYFALIVFQCLINCVSGMLLYALVRKLTGSAFASCSAGLMYAVLVGASPWVSIPYSDSVALFFPVAILTVYFMLEKVGGKGIIRLFLLAFLTYFGYRIKPQVVIVAIAIAMMKAEDLVIQRRRKKQRGVVKHAAAFGCGLLCAVLLCQTMADDVKVEIDTNKSFGLPHFLMMGLNTEEYGAYYQRDVSRSWWCETQEERTRTNLTVAAERLQEMGLIGFAQLMIRKTLTNYNDGTFCWGGEGIFYREILPEENGILAPLMRNIYYGPGEIYTGEYGRYYGLWSNTVQAVWMLILVLALICAFVRREKGFSVLMLSVIGLTVFELIFEARARYLFCYLPLYIALAAAGLDALYVKHHADKLPV